MRHPDRHLHCGHRSTARNHLDTTFCKTAVIWERPVSVLPSIGMEMQKRSREAQHEILRASSGQTFEHAARSKTRNTLGIASQAENLCSGPPSAEHLAASGSGSMPAPPVFKLCLFCSMSKHKSILQKPCRNCTHPAGSVPEGAVQKPEHQLPGRATPREVLALSLAA